MSLTRDTTHAARRASSLGVLVTVLAMLAALLAPAASAAVPPSPTTLPAGIEALQPYVGQSMCDPVAKPGVRAFSNLILDTYRDTTSLGIVRDCGVGGQSEHKEGRAWDWGVSISNPTQAAEVESLLGPSDLTGHKGWLLASDRYGNRAAMARRLGIMYAIWNNRIWKAYQIDKGWQPYSGGDSHTGHVHFSFGWAGARQVTSYWTGKVAPIDYGPSGPPVVTPVVTPANLPILALYGSSTLQVGSTGEAVKVIQGALRVVVDGSFGSATKSAVSTFQSRQGLPITGSFGPTEWKKLFPPPVNPFGALEQVDPALGTSGNSLLTGWGIDADQDVPLTVHIYVDGVYLTRTVEDQPRPDITSRYTAFTAAHGFRFPVLLSQGTHQVCVYGLNVTGTPGRNDLLGCQTTVVQHSPLGVFDSAVQGPGGTLATGWAIDPDTADPVTLTATLDGVNLPGPLTASISRPSLLTHFQQYGDKHAFSIPIATSQGLHRVCVQAVNVTGSPGTNTSLGCKDLTVRHDAYGVTDPLGARPGLVIVGGRALDPDVAAASTVHVYVDGAFKVAVPASGTQPAVPGYVSYGATRGYHAELALTQGTHQVCAFSLNAGGTPGRTMPLPCQSVTVNHQPFGNFESLRQVEGGAIGFRGWALDPDDPAPVTVQVVVDGKRLTDQVANLNRTDVAGIYPLLGAAHGYAGTLSLADGAHKVCLTYVNLTGTPGASSAAACRSLTVRHSPIGAAPTFVRVPAGVVVKGWALDPDSTAPLTVRVLVDGVQAAQLIAGAARPDVAALYPASGAGHGFVTAPLTMTQGQHAVCITALNKVGTPGADSRTGCATVTVNHNPIGSLQRTVVRTDGLAVYGWALDPDSARPVQVHLSLDGKDVPALTAGRGLVGFGLLYPGYGDGHGWQTLLHPTKGTHQLCFRADNYTGTPGAASKLGCRSVTT